ncbi:MAG: T9SS type A sorting domain-containing protein [Bacteroidales bacterium]|nr:T9SS type A sorting domain-containing protein [Bacteroidales bacterium]
MKKYILSLLLSVASFVMIAQTAVTYTFDDLQVAPLNGQDNWVSVKHSAGGGVFNVDYLGPEGITTPDESLGVFFTNANTNYGEVATRKSTDNFSFDFSQGGIIELELDLSNNNYWGQAFGLGFDADGNGTILPPMIYEAVYPAPNLPTQDGGIYMFMCYDRQDDDRFHCGIVTPENVMAAEFVLHDREPWMRFKILIDLDANDHQGSIALFVDNGINGMFAPIPEVQGINAGLTPGTGDRFDPASWDGVFFLCSSHGGFDNFTIRQTPAGASSQFLDFTEISDKLIFDEPFNVYATCTSGLPITYEILSGPATIEDNMITLTGAAGIVKVQASQPGNEEWLPAPSVIREFEVIDPADFEPTITIRRPYENTKVYMQTLQPMIFIVSVEVEHSDVILVENMQGEIDGETVMFTLSGNNYYKAVWTPTTMGNHTINLNTTLSGENTYSESSTFEITDEIQTMDVVTFNGDIQISPSVQLVTAEFVMPSYVGSFNAIRAFLEMNCAPGGCDTYDRVGRVRAKNMHGDWVELFKYITPFGVACSDGADVSEYASVLQGLVEFEFEVVTWNGGGYLPVLTFTYTAGEPEYNYSDIVEIWHGKYDFGDYANLQPIPQVNWQFNQNVEKAQIVMSTTGHMWSSNTSPNYSVNSQNAAEFYEGTHFIHVNGNQEFTQHLWPTSGSCSPNPASCQPQNGTWTYPRQGWCPGSIALIWNWDLTPFISNGSVNLDYEFDPTYVDYCHPNHPDCVDGQNGCPNCMAPDNPLLDVSGKVVVYSNSSEIITSIDENTAQLNQFNVDIFPNPAKNDVTFTAANDHSNLTVQMYNIVGQLVKSFSFQESTTINISDLPKGAYLVKISGKNMITKKLIVQ